MTQQVELTLLEEYVRELEDYNKVVWREVLEDKERGRLALQEAKRKLQLLQKQMSRCRLIFLGAEELQRYESDMYRMQGTYKMNSALYYGCYDGGMFAPTEEGELRDAIGYFDKALQLFESHEVRLRKVKALHKLGEKKKALEELDQLLQLYSADDNYNEQLYLELRKFKDELETPAPSAAERLVRSLFGRL